MKRFLCSAAFLFVTLASILAQDYNEITDDGTFTAAGYGRNRNFGRSDSIQSQHKEVHTGVKVWTIDSRFGDRREATPDTLQHLFMNTIFTTGLRGEYNTLGNVGSPRINRIFIDRKEEPIFAFLAPYDFFITPVEDFHFTNTYSPITNISYNSCGNRTNGEDHFKALFAVNAGKRLGMGFKFDYIYGRGYYSNQNTSHFNYTMYGSYQGDRYQAHLLMSTNHQKVAENGGITNDNYITHPEAFNESYTEDEIPTVLAQNWNRNDHHHVYLNHRYSLGFSRKVPMTDEEIEARKFAMKAQKEQQEAEAKRKAMERARKNGEDFDEEEYERERQMQGRPANAPVATNVASDVDATDSLAVSVGNGQENADTLWLKDEYVPVTSFIHTASMSYYRRIYQAYETPTDYYQDEFFNAGKLTGDSIFDKTGHWELRNTIAVALLEGFNKWAKAGLKVFASHQLYHYTLPDITGLMTSYNQNSVSVGGQIDKTQGSKFHYHLTGEAWVAGDDAGQLAIDAASDFRFPLLGDTVMAEAKAFLHHNTPTFYQEHYQSRHFWWDNTNLDNVIHTRLEGLLHLEKTRTQLRVAVDELKNHIYLGQAYDLVASGNNYLRKNVTVGVRQASDAISLLTLQLRQDFTYGILNWENEITYQHSTKQDVIAVPTLNLYSNLYLKFKIAKVLKCDMGVDLRYFTKYAAPEYSPALGQYTVQETEDSRVKIGGYPVLNAYANFHLKHTRFFVMMSHVNYGDGGNYFFAPHYPLNQRIFRFGLSWNFFN